MDVQDSTTKQEQQCKIQGCKSSEDSTAGDNSPSDVNPYCTLDVQTLENKLPDSNEKKTIAEDVQESKQHTDFTEQNNFVSDSSSFCAIEVGTLKSNDKPFDSDKILKDVQKSEENTDITEKVDSASNVDSISVVDTQTLEHKLQDEQCNSNSMSCIGKEQVINDVQENVGNTDAITKDDTIPDFSSSTVQILENNLCNEQHNLNNFLEQKDSIKDVQGSEENMDITEKDDSPSNVNSISTECTQTLEHKLQDEQCNSNTKSSIGKEQVIKDVQKGEENTTMTPKDECPSDVTSFNTVEMVILKNNLQGEQTDSDSKVPMDNAENVEMCKQNSPDIVNNSLALNLLKEYNSEDSESETTECFNCETSNKNSTLLKDTPLTNSNVYREEINSDTDKDNSDVECISDQKEIDFFNKDDAEDDDDEDLMEDGDKVNKRKPKPPRVHGELLLEDLPPIQDLHITVPEEECVQFGQVHSIVEQLVLVSTLPTSPLLNLDTVLFLDKGRRVLGEIFDVCGPVTEPLYCIRFNSNDQIKSKNITVGDIVYVAPKTEHTQYVILSSLMKMRGSDASWEHDIEPPPRFLDYSDDEEERRARQKLKNNKRTAENNDKSDSSDDNHTSIQKVAPPIKKGLRNQRNRRNPRISQSITDDSNCSRWRQPSSIRHPYQNSWHSNYSQRYPSGQFPSNYTLPGNGAYSQFYATAAARPPPHISHAVRPPPLYPQRPPRLPPSNFVRNPFNKSYNS